MRVLIVATGAHSESGGIGERPPSFLLPLIDRPFLQHVVEYVADAGIADIIDIVLNHFPERTEALLGDGTRWGLQVRYHLARDASQPYGVLSTISVGADPLLLVHADCLPLALLKEAAMSPASVVFCSGGTWTGWAVLDLATLRGIQPSWNQEQTEHWIMGCTRRRGTVQECREVLGVRSEAELIASQAVALDKRFPGLIFHGREVQEGVWISRNVMLHPTATVVPPVYLGENVRVGAGIRIGPNAVVVRDCVLDRGTTVADSAILPGSYVGQELELDHVIVDRNRLVNVKAGGEVIVRDDFILSGITRNSFRATLISLQSRTAALLLLLLTWPLLLLTALGLRCFRRGPVTRPVQALRLPASENSWEWKTFELNRFGQPEPNSTALAHFFLQFLPGLINVLRGQLHLVGVAPRDLEEVSALSSDWKTLYLRARAGLVTEAFANYGYAATADEVYSSEAYYSVAAGPRHDFTILLRYLAHMLRPRPTPRTCDLGGANLDMK